MMLLSHYHNTIITFTASGIGKQRYQNVTTGLTPTTLRGGTNTLVTPTTPYGVRINGTKGFTTSH
jgi:hypothetical protein